MNENQSSIMPLKLEHVWYHSPRGMPLIKDFTFSLEKAGKAIVVGPNGAGKSLLLRLCHGLIKPSKGTLTWRHNDHGPQRQAMVFQRPVMLRRTSAANIEYALKLKKVDKAEREAIVHDVLDKTGLGDRGDQMALSLSFGEQQRLALARAWALRPDVLFMDEPTASLDPSAAHFIEKLINAVHAQGTKIIMTTHDLSQARRLADEVLFLHRGRLIEHSAAGKFFKQPANELAAAFLKGELLWHRGEDKKRSERQYAR